MPEKSRTKPKGRKVYPLDVSALADAINAAKKKTGIKSKAQIMRMAIERGLPVLIEQLSAHRKQAA